jgi:hypothetical protein
MFAGHGGQRGLAITFFSVGEDGETAGMLLGLLKESNQVVPAELASVAARASVNAVAVAAKRSAKKVGAVLHCGEHFSVCVGSE